MTEVAIESKPLIERPSTLPRPPGNKTRRIVLTDEERVYMHQEYALSKNIAYLAIEMGISENIVKKELQNDGVRTRTGREYLLKLEELEQDYVYSDLDIKEMAVKYNIGKNSLFKLFRQKGWQRLVWKRRYFRDVWNRKMSKEDAQRKMNEVIERMSENTSGSNNPMYGKPSPQGSSNGWKGWYKGHYFRSLREVAFMVRMDNEGKEWRSGESISIPYIFEGKDRTYHPDFVVGDTIYEIKPLRLHKTPNIEVKTAAAIQYCEGKGLKYSLIDEPLKSHKIARAVIDNHITFSQSYRKKFMNYMVQNLREIALKAMSEEAA